ncbi:MAG: VOC family protein [Candidatus Dormibacteria bacterium]
MPELTGINHLSLTVTNADSSAAWYMRALGLGKLTEHRSDEHTNILLIHPGTGLMIGLSSRANSGGQPFDEHRTGMDHISFTVSSRAALDEWRQHFDEQSVEQSPVSHLEYGSMLVFRDHDNIQLELFAPVGS